MLDAFGHISLRHPSDPSRFFLSRHRAPPLVEPADILEFNLDCEPVTPTDKRLYGERIIHGSIYRVRPDVRSVVHHHAPWPSCRSRSAAWKSIAGLISVGVGGRAEAGPLWDSRDDSGDTSLLVTKPEEGASLAKALRLYAPGQC